MFVFSPGSPVDTEKGSKYWNTKMNVTQAKSLYKSEHWWPTVQHALFG